MPVPEEGIFLVSTKANEAGQHAIDVGNRAQAAQQSAFPGRGPLGQHRASRR
jgi:hypothetical protein